MPSIDAGFEPARLGSHGARWPVFRSEARGVFGTAGHSGSGLESGDASHALDRALLRLPRESKGETTMIHWKVSALTITLGAAATVGFVWLARSPLKRIPARSSPREIPRESDPDADAKADAFRDFDDAETEPSELDFAEPIDAAPAELRPLEDEAFSNNEPYDAVDPESLGSEFLRRATGSEPNRSDEAPPFDEATPDVAPELPVGSVDAQGNTELHEPKEPNQRTVELLPNDEELARRAATEERKGSGNPNG